MNKELIKSVLRSVVDFMNKYIMFADKTQARATRKLFDSKFIYNSLELERLRR